MKASTWVFCGAIVLAGLAVCAWIFQPDFAEKPAQESAAPGNRRNGLADAASAKPHESFGSAGAVENEEASSSVAASPGLPPATTSPASSAEPAHEAARRAAGDRNALAVAVAKETAAINGKPAIWRSVFEVADPSGLVFELEAGTRPPVVLLENDQEMTPAQAKAVERIAGDFSREVQQASTQSSDEAVLAQAWDDARKRADERYHILIGNDAYLRASVRAMREAWRLSAGQ